MVEEGVIHLGIDLSRLLAMTLYEWGLMVVRKRADDAQRDEVRYMYASYMAVYCNTHRDTKKKKKPFLPEDFL